MKRRINVIGLLMLVALASCHRSELATRCVTSQSLALSSLDTLMQTRPDSALTVLVEGYERFDTSIVDHHYYHLLLSEALYKNYCPQTDREALLESMAFYDSLCEGKAARRNASIPYLAARCHYMNGVGYYEMDSVVLACTEYLKALELMEEHYPEKELVGEKAKFMALANTRLLDVFTDQYLHEQAIYFGKRSLNYYVLYGASPWHIASVQNWIGTHYQTIEQLDSAYYYFRRAMEVLPDTNNLIYRDNASERALLSYRMNHTAQPSLDRLHGLLAQAESEKEYLARCLAVGNLFYSEYQYDSAWVYLNKVFNNTINIAFKKQAAEWLVEICKDRDVPYDEYADLLVPFANQEENNSGIRSQLTGLYNEYIKKIADNAHQKDTRRRTIRLLCLFGIILALLFGFSMLIRKSRMKRHQQEIKEEQRSHKTKQRALGGKMRETNKVLRSQIKENERLLQLVNEQQTKQEWDSLDMFLDEAICQEILSLAQDIHIKREAKIDDYPELRLDERQLSQLEVAVERHFNGFGKLLSKAYPKIKPIEMQQCMLCLFNLQDVQIAALLHCDYSTIRKRSKKLQKAFGLEQTLKVFIRGQVL